MSKRVPLGTIPSLLAGCWNARPAGNALQLLRLPTAMMPLHLRERDPLAVLTRAECSSGIRLRCRTEAPEIGLHLRFGDVPWPQSRNYHCVLDGPDGELRTIGPDAPEGPVAWQGSLDLSGCDGLVDLWLPHTARTDIVAIVLPDGAELEPAPPVGGKWLALGDSITQGMQASLPTRTHVGRVARALELEVLNLGVGGAILDPELATSIPDWDWDIATIAYGTNDANRGISPAAVAARAAALVDALAVQRPHAPIVLITVPTWIDPPIGADRLAEYRAALAEVGAGRNSVTVLDGASLIPPDPDNFIDGVHPNDTGFAAYANKLTTTMTPLL